MAQRLQTNKRARANPADWLLVGEAKMDTLTKSMQGNTKPLGMTGTVPGIEKLPTNFGGAKPIDAMGLAELNPAMNRTLMGPLGPQRSAYMPSGTNFDPMSSKQDLVDYVAGKGAGGDDPATAKRAALAREEMLAQLTKSMAVQDLDLSSSIRRRR